MLSKVMWFKLYRGTAGEVQTMPNEKRFEAYKNELDPAQWLLGGFPLKKIKLNAYELAET